MIETPLVENTKRTKKNHPTALDAPANDLGVYAARPVDNKGQQVLEYTEATIDSPS